MSGELRRATAALAKGLWRRFMSMDAIHNPLNRPLARGIATIGFRKWYERELLSGHAHMVLCLLATIGLMASLEAMGGASPVERALDALMAVACALVGLWALRRYLVLLSRAESVANQASCAQCESYGLLRLHERDANDAPPSEELPTDSAPVPESQSEGQALRVRCRKCGHTWWIEP